MSKPQCYAVKGLRLGVQMTIPDTSLGHVGGARHVINGAIAVDDAGAIKSLRDAGYELEPCETELAFDSDAYKARRLLAGMPEAV